MILCQDNPLCKVVYYDDGYGYCNMYALIDEHVTLEQFKTASFTNQGKTSFYKKNATEMQIIKQKMNRKLVKGKLKLKL